MAKRLRLVLKCPICDIEQEDDIVESEEEIDSLFKSKCERCGGVLLLSHIGEITNSLDEGINEKVIYSDE